MTTILFILSSIFAYTAPIIVGWILMFGKNILSERTLKIIESFITIWSSFSVGLLLLCRTINGKCDADVGSWFDVWNCNPGYGSNSLPQDTCKSCDIYNIFSF